MMAVPGERLTCGSPVVSTTRNFFSGSFMLSLSISTSKHTRVLSSEKVKVIC